MTDADLATIEQLYANFSGAKSPFDRHRAREYLAAELVRHARELIERAKKAKTVNSL